MSAVDDNSKKMELSITQTLFDSFLFLRNASSSRNIFYAGSFDMKYFNNIKRMFFE